MPEYAPPVSGETLARFEFSDPEAAAYEISDLIESAFGPFEPEAATLWRLSTEEELSARQSATLFQEAADSEDPLGYLDEKGQAARARLNSLMRTRWAARRTQGAGCPATLVGLAWPSLPQNAREMVREGLLHLAEYEAAQVRRGAPAKTRTDTVIDDLAEIFARYTGFTGHQTALPHAERSRFIQFVQTALMPYLSLTELEADAISKRWKRFKRTHGLDVSQDK